MLIQYRVKNVYGMDRAYVVDDAVAGRKTIDVDDIRNLTALGCIFEQVI